MKLNNTDFILSILFLADTLLLNSLIIHFGVENTIPGIIGHIPNSFWIDNLIWLLNLNLLKRFVPISYFNNKNMSGNFIKVLDIQALYLLGLVYFSGFSSLNVFLGYTLYLIIVSFIEVIFYLGLKIFFKEKTIKEYFLIDSAEELPSLLAVAFNELLQVKKGRKTNGDRVTKNFSVLLTIFNFRFNSRIRGIY